MNFKRLLTTTACIAVALVLMIGCSKNEGKDIDINEVAKKMVEQTEFLGEVILMNDENIEILYSAYDEDVIEQAVVYSCASKATAEEIAVFKLKEGLSSSKGEDIMMTRIKDLINEYEDYSPAEMPKLKDAIISSNGIYVALVIADDNSKANEVFTSAFN